MTGLFTSIYGRKICTSLSLFHLLRYLIPANPLRRSWIAGGTNEATLVRTFLPGVGSLANYHPFKHNGM